MKRILALILSVVLMLGIAVPAYAIGDENIDSGGGNLGNGTSTSYWNPGMDGVRVSVIDADSHAVVGNVIDLTNKTPSSGIIHFGKVSKLSYNAGRSLSPVVGNYRYITQHKACPVSFPLAAIRPALMPSAVIIRMNRSSVPLLDMWEWILIL